MDKWLGDCGDKTDKYRSGNNRLADFDTFHVACGCGQHSLAEIDDTNGNSLFENIRGGLYSILISD